MELRSKAGIFVYWLMMPYRAIPIQWSCSTYIAFSAFHLTKTNFCRCLIGPYTNKTIGAQAGKRKLRTVNKTRPSIAYWFPVHSVSGVYDKDQPFNMNDEVSCKKMQKAVTGPKCM